MRAVIRHRPAADWPTPEHRSLAQIYRTTELRTMPRKLLKAELEELIRLESKAIRFNPAEEPERADSA